jgi:hypothetical protein
MKKLGGALLKLADFSKVMKSKSRCRGEPFEN